MAPKETDEEDDDNSYDNIYQIPEDLREDPDTAVVKNPDKTYSVISQDQWEGKTEEE